MTSPQGAGQSPSASPLGGSSENSSNATFSEWGYREAINCVDRVACHATVRLTSVDPKRGAFQVRMQCQWAFRTLNRKEDTEIGLMGVPGIRMPGLHVKVEESRVWKDLSAAESGSRSNMLFWRGTSIFFMDGFKQFNVRAFPFDRQVINLQELAFVWRTSKDDDNYYNPMKVAWLQVNACSMLSEWSQEDSLITPLTSDMDTRHPYATRFQIELYIERHHNFYVRQIYFVTYMITLVSCSPLALPPAEDFMAERLSVYGSGLLTLVTFKYGIMEHLPSVPYSTYTDEFLTAQILTVTACTFESLFAFRLREHYLIVDMIENCLLFLVAVLWTLYLGRAGFRQPKHRVPWDLVREASAAEKTQERIIFSSSDGKPQS
mmetsp:Transcript_105660/g.187893  ORF Transcript_105660/g.187893 Transcript_105660/m.187893 type:complete len:377 (+) Transcript_105660:63-1193(+)